jgi:hypothetical protein
MKKNTGTGSLWKPSLVKTGRHCWTPEFEVQIHGNLQITDLDFGFRILDFVSRNFPEIVYTSRPVGAFFHVRVLVRTTT